MINFLLRLQSFGRQMSRPIPFLVLFLGLSAYAQETRISGTVVSEDSEPLPGVTIQVEGTTTGTVTDVNGAFALSVPDGATIIISYIGFTKQVIPVRDQTQFDITLQYDVLEMEEVVVIGYGTQKKSHLTGAISKVVNKNLDQIPVSRVDNALVGQIAGVNIQATGAAGNDQGVGGEPTIRIRGTGSITGDSGPLLVIDGTAVSSDFLTQLDMNDIESFEVLKDAASASIFGSRGANGVIMVTTKQGARGATRFSYHGFYGTQDVKNNPDYNKSLAQSAAEELAFRGELSARTRYKQLLGVDQNWQDIIFDGGSIQSHSISARGGGDKSRFSTSFSYLDDNGVLLTDFFKRYNLKAKVDTDVNDNLRFGISLNPSYSERRRFDGSTHDILRQAPWLPVYHDENTIRYVDRNVYPDVQVGDYALQRHFDNYDLDGDGTLIDISSTSNTNPAAKILERDRRDFRFKMFGRMYIEYDFTDDLSVNAGLSGDIQNTERTRYQGVESNRNGAAAASSTRSTFNGNHLVSQIFLNYSKTLGDHEINATGGFAAETWDEKYSNIDGTGYNFDYIPTLNGATVISGATSYEREKRLVSYVLRANYAFSDRYLASVSVRRDGSSVFGQNAKYGTFPAVSVGWRLSEEGFLRNAQGVTNLKLRVSYGVTGNDAIRIGSGAAADIQEYYPYLALLNTGSAVVNGSKATAFNAVNIANPDLQWERSVEINPAIDFGFFNNVITGSLDFYQRTSDELLLNIDIPSSSGFETALVNRGEVENKGFELELTTRNMNRGAFTWSTTWIASRNKNTLKDFGDSDGLITNVDDKRAAEWINLVGNPISSFYGYVVDRDIPLEYLNDAFHPVGGQAQDVYVKDLNGDGIIDDDDKTILGSPYPDFLWSITNTFEYKNFDLNFMFQGSHGAEVRNMGDQYLFNHFNSAQDFDPAITPDQGFIQQKIFTSDIIQDASYVALRNVNLGFAFPKSTIGKIGLNMARLYLSGQNLLYLKSSNYTGFNPEAIELTTPINYGYQRGGGPIARTIVFGVQLEF